MKDLSWKAVTSTKPKSLCCDRAILSIAISPPHKLGPVDRYSLCVIDDGALSS